MITYDANLMIDIGRVGNKENTWRSPMRLIKVNF